ncbi:MAG: hypothetical protein K6F93_05165 [Lachnospiraceae bacterium]|nr:hypothetical protein [Lachnospiraceae bacterium]
MAAGVYPSKKKDGTQYFRASVTYKGKHISLGSFDTERDAECAYHEACGVLRENGGESFEIADYSESSRMLSFSKWLALINFRDNGIYCRGPIYLRKGYFEYYLSPTEDYRFGPDDLFYYTHHAIQKRGGHLFVADYGMQVSVLSRYGVKPYSVPNRDYYFKNGDDKDFRPGNLVIVNRYMGVRWEPRTGGKIRADGEGRSPSADDDASVRGEYVARINMGEGITVVVGRYDTEEEAAVAYNKAVDVLTSAGSERAYTPNYLEDVSPAGYRVLYSGVKIREAALVKSFRALNG